MILASSKDAFEKLSSFVVGERDIDLLSYILNSDLIGGIFSSK
jgi:hypothetical protein